MKNQCKLLIVDVLRGFPVATDRSRPAESIGEVELDIWIDYPIQTQLQSIETLLLEILMMMKIMMMVMLMMMMVMMMMMLMLLLLLMMMMMMF